MERSGSFVGLAVAASRTSRGAHSEGAALWAVAAAQGSCSATDDVSWRAGSARYDAPQLAGCAADVPDDTERQYEAGGQDTCYAFGSIDAKSKDDDSEALGESFVGHTKTAETAAPDMDDMLSMNDVASTLSDASGDGLGEGSQQMASCLDDLLDAFFELSLQDDVAAPAARWGDKVGVSVYDEEAILGPYVDMGTEEELESDSGDEQDDDLDYEDEGTWDDVLDELEGCLAPRIDVYGLGGQVPRVARVLQPLCCVYLLAQDFPDQCSICLEALVGGQHAWRLPCTHLFHDVCAVRCLSSQRSRAACPVCRSDVRSAAVSCPEANAASQ